LFVDGYRQDGECRGSFSARCFRADPARRNLCRSARRSRLGAAGQEI